MFRTHNNSFTANKPNINLPFLMSCSPPLFLKYAESSAFDSDAPAILRNPC